MSKQLSKILCTGAIIATATVFTSACLAATTPSMPLHPAPGQIKAMKVLVMPLRQYHNMARDWHRALRLRKNLTPDQARTVTQAAIILYGNPELMKVGNVKPAKLKKGGQGYLITIVNQKGTVLKTIKMNARNGGVRPLPVKQ